MKIKNHNNRNEEFEEYTYKMEEDDKDESTVNGRFGDWGACSRSCGEGIKIRYCDNPAPENGGAYCDGDYIQNCEIAECQVDGGFSDWSACTVSCGGGVQSRICNNPAPAKGGDDCAGDLIQDCEIAACPERSNQIKLESKEDMNQKYNHVMQKNKMRYGIGYHNQPWDDYQECDYCSTTRITDEKKWDEEYQYLIKKYTQKYLSIPYKEDIRPIKYTKKKLTGWCSYGGIDGLRVLCGQHKSQYDCENEGFYLDDLALCQWMTFDSAVASQATDQVDGATAVGAQASKNKKDQIEVIRGTVNQLDEAHTFDALFFCLCIFCSFMGYMYGKHGSKPNLYFSKDKDNNNIFLLETE